VEIPSKRSFPLFFGIATCRTGNARNEPSRKELRNSTLLTFLWVDFMITRSPDEGGVTCGSGRAPASVEVTGVCGGAARCGGQAPGLPATLPGGAVEARRSRVARAPSRSDAAGALCDTRSHSTSELIRLEVRPMSKM